MALNDWINRQNNIDSDISSMEQLFDEAILSAQKWSLEITVNTLYDDICKKIAVMLSTTSLAEGDIPIPIRSASVDIKKALTDIVVNRIPYDNRMPFFTLADKKLHESPFVYENLGDGDYAYTLEILNPVNITTDYGPRGWAFRTKETFKEGAFWNQFWGPLTKLAKADNIQMIYHVEVQEGTEIRGTYNKTWKHSHYVDFGQFVKCVHTSKHLWENYYSVSPVISFKYTE